MTMVNIGKGIELDVDLNAMPANAIAHLLYIGARNVLMDAHAGVNTKANPELTPDDIVAQSRAVSEKKLAALMSGEVRVQSTREGDPVRAEAMAMAVAIVKGKIKAAGKKVADYEAKAIREAATKLVTPELLAKAAARVAEVKATDAGDLTELGL